MPTALIAIPAFALYLVATWLLARRLGPRARARGAPARWPALAAGAGGALLHGGILYQNLLVHNGLDLGFFNALSVVSWLMALLVVLAALGQPLENLGIGVFPLAALALGLELLFPAHHLLGPEVGPGLRLHVLVSLLSYSVLTIAAVQAILLAIQNRHLRTRHPGGFIRALPPLQTMERLLFQLIGLGFVLQSASLLTGWRYVEDLFAQHLVHKTVLSITAWLVYAVLLAGRWRFGWRGRTAVRWTLAGFTALLLAWLGSKWELEILLQR